MTSVFDSSGGEVKLEPGDDDRGVDAVEDDTMG